MFFEDFSILWVADKMTETVLVATLGAEPQVVTLTLDALTARGVVINRVVIVHTNPQLPPIDDSLKALHQ